MRRLKILLSATVLTAILPAIGCNLGHAESTKTVAPFLPVKTVKASGIGPVTPTQDALIRVLDADKEAIKTGFDSLKLDAQPSQFATMITTLIKQLRETDASGCPSEFRAARNRYIKAWDKLHGTLEKFPDSYEDVEFMDAMSSLFRHQQAKGRMMGGDMMEVISNLNAAYAEVYTSAQGYGIEVE